MAAFGSASAASLPAEDEAYLREITSFSMSRLEKEPRLLQDRASQLQADAEDLAVEHYRGFVESASSVRDARESLGSMDGRLDALLGQLPSFAKRCSSFAQAAQRLRQAQRLNQLMLDNESQLLEILEMPQLMERCARCELYEAALDLEAYARTLLQRHRDVPVVRGIADEMALTLDKIHAQLVATLGSTVKLPVCLAVIGHLRRMGRFSEHGLRAQFLRSRSEWLDGQVARLAPLAASSPYGYVTKFLECNRTALFEVVTQYRSIFVDDSDADDAGAGAGGEAARGRSLLFYWSTGRVSALLDAVREALPTLPDASFVASALEQCMYCGQSLARVGLDFRGLLPPLFEGRVMELFRSHLAGAPRAFGEDLAVYDWHIPPARLSKLGLAGDSPLLPYPPLAMLASRLVTAFNQLRQCAPHSLRGDVAREVEHALAASARHVHRLASESFGASLDDAEAAADSPVGELARAMAEILLPHVEGMMNAVYGGEAGRKAAGEGPALSLAAVRRSLEAVYAAPELAGGGGGGGEEEDEMEGAASRIESAGV